MRSVRNSLIKEVPTLAPNPIGELDAVRYFIQEQLEYQKLDPEQVPEAAYNKIERHGYAGYFIGQMTRRMIQNTADGTPRLTTIERAGLFNWGPPADISAFANDLKSGQLTAAELVGQVHSSSEYPSLRWYGLVQVGIRFSGQESLP